MAPNSGRPWRANKHFLCHDCADRSKPCFGSPVLPHSKRNGAATLKKFPKDGSSSVDYSHKKEFVRRRIEGTIKVEFKLQSWTYIMMQLTTRFSAIVLTALSVAGFAVLAQAQENAGRKLIEESRKVALQVSHDLSNQLIQEMQLSGPLRALMVCKYSCPEILSNHSRKTGWRVAAVSLKPRNSALGMADVWEQKVLADFDRRVANGEKAETLEFAETVSEPQGRYFRYARAMMVERLCLTCHSARDKLPDAVRAQLAVDYPFDRAVDFSLGQVYGIVTIKREN